MTDDQAWEEARRLWPHFGALAARTKEGKCHVSNEYSINPRVRGTADTWEEAFEIAIRAAQPIAKESTNDWNSNI